MSEKIKINGSIVVYNKEERLIKTTVLRPILNAGMMLNWHEKFSKSGISLNKKIIDMIINTKSTLLIHVITADGIKTIDEEFHISYTIIDDFIKNNNSDLIDNYNKNHVIPWNLFSLPSVILVT